MPKMILVLDKECILMKFLKIGEKKMKEEAVLISFKFTDDSHDTLESVTVNLKDLFDEYGYIPRAEAIPIEWIEEYVRKMCADDGGRYSSKAYAIEKMTDDWRKENEQSNNT